MTGEIIFSFSLEKARKLLSDINTVDIGNRRKLEEFRSTLRKKINKNEILITSIKDTDLTTDEYKKLGRCYPHIVDALTVDIIRKVEEAERNGQRLPENTPVEILLDRISKSNYIILYGQRCVSPVDAKVIQLLVDNLSNLERKKLFDKPFQSIINIAYRFLLITNYKL